MPQDYSEAFKWYRLAAEQGDASAQGILGYMYANGEGVPQDNAKAIEWYRLAADQDDAYAQGNLGYMYSSGLGVPQDYAEAVKWFLGSRLIDCQSQNMTVAARATADRKVLAHRS